MLFSQSFQTLREPRSYTEGIFSMSEITNLYQKGYTSLRRRLRYALYTLLASSSGVSLPWLGVFGTSLQPHAREPKPVLILPGKTVTTCKSRTIVTGHFRLLFGSHEPFFPCVAGAVSRRISVLSRRNGHISPAWESSVAVFDTGKERRKQNIDPRTVLVQNLHKRIAPSGGVHRGQIHHPCNKLRFRGTRNTLVAQGICAETPSDIIWTRPKQSCREFILP